MELLTAIVIGGLFGAAIYLLLTGTPFRLIIGLVILSNAINLLIFVAGGLTPGKPPLIAVDEKQLLTASADPLPQALILTAIVISFGVLAFTLVLFRRAFDRLCRPLVDLEETDRQ